MKKSSTVNTCNEGMVMDLNPIVTPNNVLTSCLNGTIITFNGNENVLLNDMGNGRVETAYLPEGYVPMGTAELGGIIYIVSYNPIIDKCLIGSFPSPERNITSEEIKNNTDLKVKNSDFLTIKESKEIETDNGKITEINDAEITNTIKEVILLKDFKLQPGDKYSIYSTNSGITNNIGYLSDTSENPSEVKSNRKVGGVPKNITIHIVSIGDDGSITNLDDYLKWDNTLNYYIKEASDTKNIQKDIDNYRSLVSSAYNIFNNKISGLLALSFEVETIDTFSVTWNNSDIIVVSTTKESNDEEKKIIKNTNNPTKQTDISFTISWTSRADSIKPKYAILSESKFEGVEDSCYNKNYYVETNENERTYKVGTFLYNPNEKNQIWDYKVTPAMSFGRYTQLDVEGKINFEYLGTGKILLSAWKYYIYNNNILLSWTLDAYPEVHKEIKGATFTFLNLNKYSPDEITNLVSECNDSFQFSKEEYPQYTILQKQSWSGIFNDNIYFNNVSNGGLSPNQIYLVDLCFTYGNEDSKEKNKYIHIFRWLYTSDQWNSKFNTEKDFSDLELDLDVDIIGSITSYGNSESVNQNDYYPNLKYENVPNNWSYTTMGVKLTSATIKRKLSIEYELANKKLPFTYSKESNFKKASYKCYIKQDTLSVYSENQEDGFMNVASLVMNPHNGDKDNVKAYSNANSIALTIPTTSLTEENNKILTDNFYIDKEEFTNTIDITMHGSIFSRINAYIKEKNTNYTSRVRPLLYETKDYIELGFNNKGELPSFYTITHRDLGKGGQFAFNFYKTNIYDSKDDGTSGESKYWDPGDTFGKSLYWDGVPPYTDWLNRSMLDNNSFFYLVLYQSINGTGGRETGTYYNNRDNTEITFWGELWVRTSNNHYMPVNDFWLGIHQAVNNEVKETVLEIENRLKALYTSIYRVESYENLYKAYIINDINYIRPYNESFNVDINIFAKHNSGTDFVMIGDNKLDDYIEKLENLLNTKNIKYNINDFSKTINISRLFSLDMSSMYKIYDSKRDNTNYNTLYCVSTKDEPFIGPALNSGSLYNWDGSKFINLSEKLDYLYKNVTIKQRGDNTILVTPSKNISNNKEWIKKITNDNSKLYINEDWLEQERFNVVYSTSKHRSTGMTCNGHSKKYLGIGKYLFS